ERVNTGAQGPWGIGAHAAIYIFSFTGP
ncbi:hypothetical protein CEXT_788671, partial [Caerostris extrusa]